MIIEVKDYFFDSNLLNGVQYVVLSTVLSQVLPDVDPEYEEWWNRGRRGRWVVTEGTSFSLRPVYE